MNVAPISFCDKIAFNVRDELYKTTLLEKIFKLYNIIVTDNNCHIYNKQYSSIIQKSSYLLSTNTTGNRYFLYFTKDELENNLCFFIDKKICKGYKYPRIIYTKFRFSDKVFQGTLLYGELIKDYNQNWLFLINDVISYCGEKLTSSPKITRIKKIYSLLNTHYNQDSILDVCNFQIKRYFEYKQLNYLLNKFIPNLQYNINGLLFNGIHFKQPNILLLNRFTSLRKKQTIKKDTNTLFTIQKNSNLITEKNTNIITEINRKPIIELKLPKKEKSIINKLYKTSCIKKDVLVKQKEFDFIIDRKQGIFQLICLINKNKKVFGYARIDSLKKQKIIIGYLQTLSENQELLMKCQYNKKFKKFVPIEKSNSIEPCQYLDATNYVSLQ